MNAITRMRVFSKRAIRYSAAFVGLLMVGMMSVMADTHYVVPPGTPGVDTEAPYTSWGTAGTSIVEVVNAALALPEPRTVVVSNGEYVLESPINITNALTLRSQEGHGPDDTVIRGGFTAGGPVTNRCLVMNSPGAFVHGLAFSDGAVISANNEGGGGVRMYSGVLSNCTVRGNSVFIFGNWSNDGGGGLYMTGASTAMQCRVINNKVAGIGTAGATPVGQGGGIFASGSSARIMASTISNNVFTTTATKSYFGGGVCLQGGARIDSSLIHQNSGPGGGSGTTYGGGIYILQGFMNACTSSYNSASLGGGCQLIQGVVSNSLILGNSAGSAGGSGMINDRGTVYGTTITGSPYPFAPGTATLHMSGGKAYDCVISNKATTHAVLLQNANESLNNCQVVDNTRGAAILAKNGTIRNCLVARNLGGGILLDSTFVSGSISGCTIADNLGSSGFGMRIDATAATQLSISSCVIYSNGVAGSSDVINNVAPAYSDALHHCLLGTNPGFTGAGIKVDNPRFVNFAAKNYRLSGNSPCIDAGSYEEWMATSHDLDDGPRVRGGGVDMGAYEYVFHGTVLSIR